ncbi:MAG: arginine N-succinyltransferase [Litorimonas sp.]
MDIFRVATIDDIDAIHAFTKSAGEGLTTVPRTRERVADYIKETHRFLSGDKTANRVLFTAQRGDEILGISGIIPKLGVERPFYSFKRARHARRSSAAGLSVKYETLQLTTDFDDYTELATMYLSPQGRGTGMSRLLSLGRIAFIERHQDLFDTRLMAEIRGWFDENGNSPFWQDLTSRFIQTDFEIADRLSSSDGRFIIELLPSLPIMLNLLPQAVRDCTGKPHELSAIACGILLEAGFKETDLCDLFDGGPSIECFVKDTLISRTYQLSQSMTDMGEEKLIHFGGKLKDFRATFGMGNLVSAQADEAAQSVLDSDIYIARVYDKRRAVKPMS